MLTSLQQDSLKEILHYGRFPLFQSLGKMQSDRPAPPYVHRRTKVQALFYRLLKERKEKKELAAENAALKEQVTGNSTFPKLAAKDGAVLWRPSLLLTMKL